MLAHYTDPTLPHLNIGSGDHPIDRAVNIDVREASEPDILSDFLTDEYPEGWFQRITCFHTLEHMTADEGQYAVWKMHRLLAPLGECILATPDIRAIAGLLLMGDPELTKFPSGAMPWSPDLFTDHVVQELIFGCLDGAPGVRHLHHYCKYSLRALMHRAGFSHVVPATQNPLLTSRVLWQCAWMGYKSAVERPSERSFIDGGV
jgi:predicted SAM-dependent methyltransferase